MSCLFLAAHMAIATLHMCNHTCLKMKSNTMSTVLAGKTSMYNGPFVHWMGLYANMLLHRVVPEEVNI